MRPMALRFVYCKARTWTASVSLAVAADDQNLLPGILGDVGMRQDVQQPTSALDI
ncbi:MAG: hypothetical protein GX772_14150 [Alcaligenaceae bacterium]|nr:hypothetical protein [Alcaligenaceae bacterium]